MYPDRKPIPQKLASGIRLGLLILAGAFLCGCEDAGDLELPSLETLRKNYGNLPPQSYKVRDSRDSVYAGSEIRVLSRTILLDREPGRWIVSISVRKESLNAVGIRQVSGGYIHGSCERGILEVLENEETTRAVFAFECSKRTYFGSEYDHLIVEGGFNVGLE